MGYKIIAREVDSGYGIADIVATIKGETASYYAFNSLSDVYLFYNISMTKPMPFEEISRISPYSERYLKYGVLKGFIDAGLVKKEGSFYRRSKKMPIVRNPVIAVEAKLKKWKTALFQAKRYMKYADFCYVALPEKTIKDVDLEMFKENNVGIIAVTQNNKAYSALKSKKNKQKELFYSIFINGSLFKEQLNE